MAQFRWTEASTEAAQLVARGDLSYPGVAKAVDVTRQTIYNWRQDPEFMARVEEHREEFRAEVRRIGIADVYNRVSALNDRWNRMRRVIEERADHPTMANAPGGRTGLLVHNVKAIGTGESMVVVDEYEVDTGLLKELRDHEKQAAQELGQWEERTSSKVQVTELPPIRIVEVNAMPPRQIDFDQPADVG